MSPFSPSCPFVSFVDNSESCYPGGLLPEPHVETGKHFNHGVGPLGDDDAITDFPVAVADQFLALHVFEVAGADELLALPVLVMGGANQNALVGANHAEAVVVADFADFPDLGDKHLLADGAVLRFMPDVIADGAVDGRHPDPLLFGEDRAIAMDLGGDDYADIDNVAMVGLGRRGPGQHQAGGGSGSQFGARETKRGRTSRFGNRPDRGEKCRHKRPFGCGGTQCKSV